MYYIKNSPYNLCEYLSKFTLEEIDKLVVDMLIGIQMKLMPRIQVKLDKLRDYNVSCQPYR